MGVVEAPTEPKWSPKGLLSVLSEKQDSLTKRIGWSKSYMRHSSFLPLYTSFSCLFWVELCLFTLTSCFLSYNPVE